VGFTICGWLRPGDPAGFGALGLKKGEMMSKDLYVTNIALEATEEEVRKLFSVVGKVAYIHLVTDANTGQFKGCGYVKMASEKDARDAITTLDGARLINRIIKVSEARPQKTAGPKGGAERRPPVRDKGPAGRRK
jgi:RNA recognition motif-containing protein